MSENTAAESRDAEAIWSDHASTEIAAQPDAPLIEVEYVPRNIVGRTLLALSRRRLYSYAEADRPKMQWIEQALRGTGPRVLDVGIRTGDLARFFTGHGKSVYGLDIAQAYVDHCRAQGVIVDGAVCNVEAEAIPVPSSFRDGDPDAYDIIFLGEIIEHLLSPKDVIKKMAGVCRPGGVIIITTPNLAYLGNRLRLLMGRDLHLLTMDRGEEGNQHIRVFTGRLIRSLLLDAGFTDVDISSDGVPLGALRFVDAEVTGQGNGARQTLFTAPLTRWPVPTIGRTLFVRAVRGDD